MHVHRQRAFTLLEMLTALAIMGVLVSLAVATLSGLKGRAEVGMVLADVASAVRATRAQALGNGSRTAFVVDTVGKRWWSLATPDGLNLDTFDPSAPGQVILSGVLPNTMSFGPAAGFGADLAAPFGGVPARTGAPKPPNLPFCSFCRTSGVNSKFGLVLFESDGRATFEAGAPKTIGQQFTLTGTTQTGTRTLTVAVIARTGLVETFEK